MKTKASASFAMAALFVLVTFSAQTAAQTQTSSQPNSPVRYKLIDLGTLGGPSSAENPQSPVVNNQAVVVGFAETAVPDPNAPNCLDPQCFLAHAFRWNDGTFTDLGTLPGGQNSVAFQSNARGQTVGVSDNGVIDPLTGGVEGFGVIWQESEIVNLRTLGGNQSFANAINNRGEVVGWALNTVPDSTLGLGTQQRPFLWRNGIMRDLGDLGGGNAMAMIVNALGQVAGASLLNSSPNPNTGFPTFHTFLWDDGKLMDLGSLGGTQSAPAALNNRAQVTGTSTLDGDFTNHGFLWTSGTLRDLGTLGGDFSFGNALNDQGDVVGAADTADGRTDAFFWRNGTMTDIGTVAGDSCSIAHAINTRAQVVGTSFDCLNFGVELHGFLWQPGGSIIDLNSFVPPGSDLVVTDGETINDRGEIAGSGMLPNGDFHAVLLIPCGDDTPDAPGCLEAIQKTSPLSTSVKPVATTKELATKATNTARTGFAHLFRNPFLRGPRNYQGY